MSNTQKIIKKQSVRRILDEMRRFQISIDDLFAEKEQVAVILSPNDVDDALEHFGKIAEPPLSQEEKIFVLQRAKEKHNLALGVSLDDLRCHAVDIFGTRIKER